MLKPRPSAYRVCPACTKPLALADDVCPHCGHSLSGRVADIEAQQLLRGRVFYNGQWMTIEEKAQQEKFVAGQLALGLVEHNGTWMTIEEKLKIAGRDSPAAFEKVVEFPVKPVSLPDQLMEKMIPESMVMDETEIMAPARIKTRKKRQFAVAILLAVVTFFVMMVAAVGIFFPRFFR